jgi:hypothetical protein
VRKEATVVDPEDLRRIRSRVDYHLSLKPVHDRDAVYDALGRLFQKPSAAIDGSLRDLAEEIIAAYDPDTLEEAGKLLVLLGRGHRGQLG